MTPQKYCHEVCQKSGSNFVLTFYLYRKKKRQAFEAFYAFCRKVDDAVDLADSPEKARQAILYWKEEIPILYQGNPRHPVSKALIPVIQQYSIPQKYLAEIVLGCEMDLYKKIYVTFADLEEYCFRVASCVGLVCLHLFGVPLTESTQQAGIALGKALQMTNILRDIVTDLGRERIYIPQEDLKQFGVTVFDLAHPSQKNLALLDLLYFEIERGRNFYRQAWQRFPKEKKERRKLLAAFLMGRFYEALLDKMAKDPLQIFQTKVRLTGVEKAKILIDELLRWL